MKSNLYIPGKLFPYVMAHRGNRALCPENTLASFKQAFKDGCDILETDLHLSADDNFICIHDATIDRTTNGTGEINQKRLTEIKQYSAGKGFPKYSNEKVPVLEELLEVLPQDVALALELKSDRFLEPETGRRLKNILASAGILERSIILSFSQKRLAAVQNQAPELVAGVISMSNPWPAKHFQLTGPFWPLTFINPFYTTIAHARNQLTCPLDPTPDRRLWWYAFLRFDAILTDNPAKTIPLLSKYRHP
jgi:glycerophosphoryl diester phosphodiesterase